MTVHEAEIYSRGVHPYDGRVYVNVEDGLTPDEAFDLAAQLVTAANVANGYTTTGVFA